MEFAPSALYLLAAPSTPDEARQEALSLAEQGETISHAKAKTIVERHKADGEPISTKQASSQGEHKDDEDSEFVPTRDERHKDDEELARFEAIAAVTDLEDKPDEAKDKTDLNQPESDLVPFHCLMKLDQRETLYQAINQAKASNRLETTAQALCAIAEAYLK